MRAAARPSHARYIAVGANRPHAHQVAVAIHITPCHRTSVPEVNEAGSYGCGCDRREHPAAIVAIQLVKGAVVIVVADKHVL